jgi:hypothetical protein
MPARTSPTDIIAQAADILAGVLTQAGLADDLAKAQATQA